MILKMPLPHLPLSHQSSYLEDEPWLGGKRPGLSGCELHRRTQCSGSPLGPENLSQLPPTGQAATPIQSGIGEGGYLGSGS